MPRAKPKTTDAAPVTAPAVHTNKPTKMAAARAAAAAAAAKAPEKGFTDKPVTQPKRSGATVTIGCKIAGGLKLEFYNWREVRVPQRDGNDKFVREAILDASVQPIFLRGPAVPFGHMPDFRIIKGAALTSGVSKDLWDRWCRDNSQHPALLNGQLFAHENEDFVVGRAKEEAERKSGLQAMEPDTDKRIPRRRNRKGNMTNEPAITTGNKDE